MSTKTPRARANADAVYGARSRDELEAIYDRWAGEYDEDASDYFGYLGPQLALERFERLVPKEARILDAGAGSGPLQIMPRGEPDMRHEICVYRVGAE